MKQAATVEINYHDHVYTATVYTVETLISYLNNDRRAFTFGEVVLASSTDVDTQVRMSAIKSFVNLIKYIKKD